MFKGKLKVFSVILFVCVLILMVTSITTVFAAEKPITLTLNTLGVPTSLVGVGDKILKEEIEKRTNGRVEVKIYWAQALFSGKETLKAVEDGAVDISRHCCNFYPNQLPLHGVYSMIFKGPAKYKNLSWVMDACMEQIPEFKAEFLDNNQIPIYISQMLPMVICSRVPMARLEDLKNRKVRISSRWGLSMLKALGAVPVSVPWNDCFMAMQTGTIDAVVSNLDAIHDDKIDEVGKNIFFSKQMWLGTAFVYTMNLDKWNSLPKDIQGQIMEATEWTTIRYTEAYDAAWDKMIAEQKEMGIVHNVISPEEIEEWASMPVMEELELQWVKEVEDIGVKNAGELLKQVKEIVKQGIERDKQ